MQVVITCLFGLEHYCVEDLEKIGYGREEMTVSDGQILVDTTPSTMADDLCLDAPGRARASFGEYFSCICI